MAQGHRCGGCQDGQAPFGSLRDLISRERAAALAAEALAEITAVEVRDELQSCPPQVRRAVLSRVGMRDAKKVPVVAAENVLRLLQAGDPAKRAALRDFVGGGVLHDLGNADGLTGEDCAILLAPATAAEALSRARWLRRGLTYETQASILRWALARAIEEDRPLAVVALGLLAGEASGPGGKIEPVRIAWTELCKRHPELPHRPIGALDLRALGRRSASAGSERASEADQKAPAGPSGPSAATTGQPASAVPVQPAQAVTDGCPVGDDTDLDECLAALTDLSGRLAEAADGADRVAARLREGRRPEEHDLALVRDAAAGFDDLSARTGSLLGGGLPAPELAAISAALDSVRAQALRATKIGALANVQGPGFLAEQLAEVRRAAEEAEGAGLDLLAELIMVRSRPDGLLRTAELAGQAREHLPERWRTLVDVALMGQLSIDPLPSVIAVEPDTAQKPDPVTKTVAEPRPGPEAPDDAGNHGETDNDDGGGSSNRLGPEPGPGSPDPGAAAPEPAPDDDLGDLDELLAKISPVDEAAAPAAGRPVGAETSTAVPSSADAPAEPVRGEALAGDATSQVPAEAEAETREFQAGPPKAEAERPLVPPRAGAADHDPRAEPAATVMNADVAAAEAAALRAGRFGLAGWLRHSAGRPEAEADARRCAGLAANMTVIAGPLSAEFAAASRGLSLKSLADDHVGGLLVWAASVRAGLVSPTPESTRLLDELNVLVSAYPVLAECGESFVRAARSGAYVGPGHVGGGRTGGSGEADLIRQQAVREAARFLEEEQHRKIKYQLATEVWKELLNPSNGPVGRLLTIAADDDPARVEEAVTGITDLRPGHALGRVIDETTRQLTVRRRNKKIIAGARHQLVGKAELALDTVGRWVAAVKESQARLGAAQDWRHGPLEQLHTAVMSRRGDVEEALRTMAAADDPLLSAVAEAAGSLLSQAFDLLDGGPLAVAEPSTAYVLNRDLLLAHDVEVDEETFAPCGSVAVASLVPVACADPAGWTAAFRARAERRDHRGTSGIVAVLERRDPETARELRRQRDDLVNIAQADRDQRVEEIRDLTAEWHRDGVLTEAEVRRTEERLVPLTGDRRDLDHVDRALDGLRAQLDDRRQETIEAERRVLADRVRADRKRFFPVARRVEECIDRGDLTTARDFLDHAMSNKPLPEPGAEPDHLGLFYPAFPRAFADSTARTGGRARGQEPTEFVKELKEALRGGRDVADLELHALLTKARTAIPELRPARRNESGEGLRQWQALGQGQPRSTANLHTAVLGILRMIGLEAELTEETRAQDRTWIDLGEVRTSGDVLLPAFGSRMSPSGDRLRLLLVWRRPGPQRIVDLLKGQPEDRTVLVCYFGVLSPQDRRDLAAAARRRPVPPAGVLDDAAIAYLACAPEADWGTTVSVLAPFTATNPYTPVGEVPDEMFYGRDDQLREVTDRDGSSFVYGGRQLGKSALLRRAERRIKASDRDRVVVLENIQTVGKVRPELDSLWPRLADRLVQANVITEGTRQRERLCDAVRDWALADPERQLLILLDEADRFLNQDSAGAVFENVTALRNLWNATDKRVKTVFAGLHQTARFQSLPNQPLGHLGTPVAVGPLDPQDAFDLLVKPLHALGFRFGPTLAARVIAEANNAPALVQLFAEELLTRLRRSQAVAQDLPYEITREDVEEVWRDKTLARAFRDRFEWTLNLDKRYKVIAYTIALHALAEGADATLSVDELSEQCRDWWPVGFDGCASDEFRGLLDECVNLGVLGVDADRYRLRTPHILNLLGGVDEVEQVLGKADEFDLPDAFDAHSYRGVIAEGPDRSPLSSGQLARLLRPRDLVHVVVGSRALHVERVARAIADEKKNWPDLEVWTVRPGDMPLDGALARADRHDGHSVVVVDALDDRATRSFDDRLERARCAVGSQRRGTLAVVMITGPRLAPAWNRLAGTDGVEFVALRRFDRPAVRQWMWEDSQDFPDEISQTTLLKRTGGWPSLIGQVARRLADHGGDRDQALDHCLEPLRTAPGDLVAATGVLSDPSLAAAWSVLAKENAPETAAYFAGWLAMHAEETLALSADAMAANGYAGSIDLVEALHVLGALEAVGDGKLACEPVLADATRRMDAAP